MCPKKAVFGVNASISLFLNDCFVTLCAILGAQRLRQLNVLICRNAEVEGTWDDRASRGDEHSVAAGYRRTLPAQCKDANGAATARSSGYRRPPTDPARPQPASR
jgi:hypothetical protein